MQLRATDPSDSRFDSMLQELIDAVQHHVEDEESTVLPGMREQLDANRLEELGRAFATAREEHLGDRPGEATRDELLGQAQNAGIAGASSMSKDELKQALKQ